MDLPSWFRDRWNPKPAPLEERLQHVRVPFRTRVLFTQQLVVLLQGGVPLVRSLEALSIQGECPPFGRMIQHLYQRIETGHRFSECLSHYPRTFPQMYVAMVQIGEESGALPESLDRLAGWMRKDSQLLEKLRSALTYPAFIAVLTVALTMLMFYVVMPPFLAIFSEIGTELPLLTRIVLAFTVLLRSPLAWLIMTLFLAAMLRQIQQIWGDPNGRCFLYSLVLQVPLLGGILWNGAAARFSSSVEALLGCGTSLEKTMRLAAKVSGSPLMERDSEELCQSVIAGTPLSDHMRIHPDIYSPTLVHLTATGEETSRLPDMMGRAAIFHGLVMEGQVEALKVALEPVMLASVATIVGTLILSVFLPLYGFLGKLA